MKIIAIDPGPTESAYVILQGEQIVGRGKVANQQLRDDLMDVAVGYPEVVLVIEQVAAMGMSVGAEVFETVFWSGRFAEAWEKCGRQWHRVKRHEVKMHLCHHPRAKDGNIRQALIDRYGGNETAIGRKANPGPLYGISGDCWQALAVAVTWAETRETAKV